MERLGREVLFIGGNEEGRGRCSMGSFVRLKDGGIMFAYQQYREGGWDDHHTCDIACAVSYDEGETWTERRILMEKPEDAKNIGILSFMRMNNGDLGMLYAFRAKDTPDDDITGTIYNYFVRSADEGKTWSEPVSCMPTNKPNYYATNNDAAIRLKNGRIMYATARHSVYEENCQFAPGVVCFFYSDDDGYTWHKLKSEIAGNITGDVDGWQEPMVYEFEDGRLWCYVRSGLGFHFEAFSNDGGETWSDMVPNYYFTAPPSPMQIRKAGKYTVAIWNPVPRHMDVPYTRLQWRTPLVIAVSDADGKGFKKMYALEDDPNNAYCYPAVLEGKDYFLVGYCHSNNSGDSLNSVKVVKIKYEDIKLD